MKKEVLNWIAIFTMVFMCVGTTACSGEDSDSNSGESNGTDSNSEMGANNTTDIAVTGGVESTGITFANIYGYVNLTGDARVLLGDDTLPFGVVYSKTPTFTEEKSAYCHKIVGNKFMVTIKELEDNTKYYYRTFVGSQYGTEIGTFTTKPFTLSTSIFKTGTVSDIDYESVTIKGLGIDASILANETYELNVMLSIYKSNISNRLESLYEQYGLRNIDAFYSRGEAYFDYSYDNVTSWNFTMGNLFPGNKYYYCLFIKMGNHILSSNINEFSTKDVSPKTGFVDLGLSVKWATCNIGQISPWWGGYHGENYGTEMSWDEAQSAIESTYGSSARLPTNDEFKELFNLLSNDHSTCVCYEAIITGKNGKQLVLTTSNWGTYWTGTAMYNSSKAHLTASIRVTSPWNGWDARVQSGKDSGYSNSSALLVRAVMPK